MDYSVKRLSRNSLGMLHSLLHGLPTLATSLVRYWRVSLLLLRVMAWMTWQLVSLAVTRKLVWVPLNLFTRIVIAVVEAESKPCFLNGVTYVWGWTYGTSWGGLLLPVPQSRIRCTQRSWDDSPSVYLNGQRRILRTCESQRRKIWALKRIIRWYSRLSLRNPWPAIVVAVLVVSRKPLPC